MGPVPQETLRALKTAVREETEHLSPDVRRRVRTRATGALGAYWRQGIAADVAASRVLRELRAAKVFFTYVFSSGVQELHGFTIKADGVAHACGWNAARLV